MAPPTPHSLPADFQRLCPRFNMQQAKNTARWGNNPGIIPGMLYAFILQDIMRFELCSEEVTGRLVKAIEDCRWAELEAWLDTNRDVLLQRLEAEAPIPGTEGSPLHKGSPPVDGGPTMQNLPAEAPRGNARIRSDGMNEHHVTL